MVEFKPKPRRREVAVVEKKKGIRLFGRVDPELSEAIISFGFKLVGHTVKSALLRALVAGAAVAIGQIVNPSDEEE